jgi:pimeloyl-ACP methyl ester carboxylesterase
MATSADGTRIAWYRYGEGPRTVLFVPTWNLVDARVVGHQVVALEPHATVLTYDPRGAGASERPERGYDFSRHAADARAVLDATGTERAVLVTASRGLNAAVLLIADDPQRFDRLASLAPYMKLEPDPPPPDPPRDRPRGDTRRHRNPRDRARLATAGLSHWTSHLPGARCPWRSRCSGPRRPRREHRRRHAQGAPRSDSGRRASARHPQSGTRQSAPAGVPPRT